jgi:pimeloyl-ACP methyl ester carboxylesterase
VGSIYKSAAGQQAVERRYRDVLTRWPVPNRQLIVPTCQGDTFIIVSGESHAPPVVLFHGAGTNSSVWIRDVAEWAQRHRVYAVDLIGEPGFSAPSRPLLWSNAYVDWLDDVWDQLGLVRASVVGVSLGGWLGLDYAVKRPERVASLSLLSPSGIGAQNHLFLIKAGLLLRLGPWGLGKALRLVTGRANLPREMTDSLLLRFQHFRPRMEKLPIRTDEELASLTMPVQLILGGRDALIRSRETRDRMERRVPHLHLTYLEHEGHILPRQTSAIAEFLHAATFAAPCGDISRRNHDQRASRQQSQAVMQRR